MLDVINPKVFGAFSAVVILLLWAVRYFKNQYEKEKRRNEKLVSERNEEATETKDALQATLKVLKAQLRRTQRENMMKSEDSVDK